MPEFEEDPREDTPLPTSFGGDRPLEIILFGKYEIGKLLGRGAFAKVYHARNIQTGESVAIKAVNKMKILKRGSPAQVKREISIMRRLHHPHVVRLFEVLATKTRIYFVMEFAKGGELFGKVSQGRFSEDLSRRYFQQLITAVGYCHSEGIFHRDLKPENLLLDDEYNLRVSDFGLSALTDQIGPDGLLHTLCGTPAYVAPEILSKKGYDGAKIDVWSCGIILYVLNAGYLPFNDSNLMVMYRKIYRGEFHFPKWTSPDLRQLLSRLLDTNPETRITVDEILHDPWFTKGFHEEKFHAEDYGFNSFGDENNSKCLTAFDLISFSSGFDLNGLLIEPQISSGVERFLSTESPKKIIKKVEEISISEKGTVEKNGWGAKVEGHDGTFVVIVDIFRLTEKLVIVEIKKREKEVDENHQIWEHKLRPQLDCLIYRSVR